MGSRLNEVSLSAALEISRGSLRVALRQLEVEGLVTAVPYKGTFVSSLTEQQVHEIYELRTLLETFAASKIGPQVQEADLQFMEKMAKRNRDLVLEKRFQQAVKADFRFHELALKGTGNNRLIKTWTSFYDDIMRVLVLSYSTVATHSRAFEEHCAIVDALRSGNGVAVHEAIEKHMMNSEGLCLQALSAFAPRVSPANQPFTAADRTGSRPRASR